MAHEHCYAICENKSMVETYSKDQIDTKFRGIGNRFRIDPQQTHNVSQSVETSSWIDINVNKTGYEAIGIAGIQINGSTQAVLKGYRLFENEDEDAILRVTVANAYDSGSAFVQSIDYSIIYYTR